MITPDFVLEKFFYACEMPAGRSPENTVREYVSVHRLFTQACTDWLKGHDHDLKSLDRAGARMVFEELRKRYCVSQNRQYVRSAGHYYLSDLIYVDPSSMVLHEQACDVVIDVSDQTKRLFRFTLKRVGIIWKIHSVQKQVGIGLWHNETV